MINYAQFFGVNKKQGIRVDIMDMNSALKSSPEVVSQDQFFKLGLTALLGVDFLNSFYRVIDLDSSDNYSCRDIRLDRKKTVAFASTDLAFYKSDLYSEIPVLDKNSTLSEIVSFFATSEKSGNYHIKYSLTGREKQILNLIKKGESNEDIAKKIGVKLKTIYTHRRNLMIKLGCENRIMLHKLFLKTRLLISE